MYLKRQKRFKDGKEHKYWSIVESVRTRRGVIKRQVLYLGEINNSQKASWCKALNVFDKGTVVKQHKIFRILNFKEISWFLASFSFLFCLNFAFFA